MLRFLERGSPLCERFSRREWLRVGSLGLVGLTLPRLLERRATAQAGGDGPAKSVIVLFNSGGMPHHETWDPKPEAPEEIRGGFGTIATRTPGLHVGELMPQTAQLTDRIAVIRSMVTGDNSHSSSGYQMLTGVPHIPLTRENAAPGKPNDWPAMNAIVKSLRPSRGGLPSSISLPRRMANNGGQNPWPGTDGGFLGRSCDPWLLECDPAAEDFTVPGGELLEGMNDSRGGARRSLLEELNERIERSPAITNYSRYQQQAIELVAGGRGRAAFDLKQESEPMRDRYGRTKQGQSMLLARRLVEAGASLVQVTWANFDKKMPNSGSWDTHEKHNESLKGWLMPVMDQAFTALVLDLEERGLLDETLVCWVAEFGHTPKFNAKAGRDHWGRVFSIALAGGGIRGGVVYGASDKHAAEPRIDAVRPRDYLATVYRCLGFEPETLVHDIEGRPLPISRGQPIEPILL